MTTPSPKEITLLLLAWSRGVSSSSLGSNGFIESNPTNNVTVKILSNFLRLRWR